VQSFRGLAVRAVGRVSTGEKEAEPHGQRGRVRGQEREGDAKGATRAIIKAERIVRSCAKIAAGAADPLELNECQQDVTFESGVLNVVNGLQGELSAIEQDLARACRRAARAEIQIGTRHGDLLKKVTHLAYARRNEWQTLARRNTGLTKQHRKALSRLRSACDL